VDSAACLFGSPEVFPWSDPFDTILQGAHLIGVLGGDFLPSHPKIDCTIALEPFKSFYVNKYADHHVHEIVF
jgi:hypothetical protein